MTVHEAKSAINLDAGAGSDMVIVANRLPVQRLRRRHGTEWVASPGGLVSALRPILQDWTSTWVGCAGENTGEMKPFTLDGINNWPVSISPHDYSEYYGGFSNRTIWPLYHDAIRTPEYRQDWWQSYVAVNRRFVDAVSKAAARGANVWIHDYHLQLAPAMLREIRPDCRIGFFLHIPFPPQELFAQLPWRTELIQGVLGADVIGFQTAVGMQNFACVAQRFAEATVAEEQLHYRGRSIRYGAFPISVDVTHFEQLAVDPKVIAKAAEIRTSLGSSRKIMLGLDRLDYTKGIDIRLQAFRELLRSRRVSQDDCVLAQVAIPSRELVADYKQLRVEVERLVGEIEGEFGELGQSPIHYLHRSVNPVKLGALYRAADVMLVTPLRDGMNLVAKEYVASRTENTGVLVLSEFTGAAKELTSALLVNPHDIGALVTAMERALRMPRRKQEVRMNALRRSIKQNDVYHWADRFLQTLVGTRA